MLKRLKMVKIANKYEECNMNPKRLHIAHDKRYVNRRHV